MDLPHVDLHFQGFFEPKPFAYNDGIHHLFDYIDFAAMNVKECVEFLEKFTQEKCLKLYYELPEYEFREGLRPIDNEADYQDFIVVAYESGCTINLYIDHFGRDVEYMIEDEKKEQAEKEQAEKEQAELQDSLSIGSNVGQTNPNSGEEDEEEEPDFVYREEEEETQQTFYTDEIDWKEQHPVLGMRFENPKALKHMLCNYAVANGYQLFYERNDSKRLLVKCCKGQCTFRLWASWMGDENSFQIKSLEDEHNCARDYKLGPIVNYRWIGAHYKQQFLHKDKITVRALKDDVREKFGLTVSMGQCRRAKLYAMSLVEGTIVEHYARLWSYAAEIRRSNPGSNVRLEVNAMPDGKNYFSRFYVCFDGLKRGWREGCRRVLNLDGCFLKGFCSGQLLAAVGRDANNHIYPVAWGVVCVENKENWKWFLKQVSDDLNLKQGWGLTLMSDQHKGLLEVVKDVLPDAEHRQCARHILQNFQKKYRGAHFEKIFWRACKAPTEAHFNAVMKELHALNPTAHKHLLDRDPKTWSRAFFQTGRACDAFENGMAESFNSVIVCARHKPIITMLEEIRVWSMERVYTMSLKGKPWSFKICPAYKMLIDELKQAQRFWQVLPCGENMFETRSVDGSYAVDIGKKECSCRMWQLNGYGCVHSVATISFLNNPMEPFVDPMLLGNCFQNTYKFPILPMNGSDMWPTTDYIPPLPPMKRRMPGRPQVKRRRCETEGKRKNVSRAGKRVLCGNCKQPGHNKSTCRHIPPPVQVNVEQGEGSGVNTDGEENGPKKKQKMQDETSATKNNGKQPVNKKGKKTVNKAAFDGGSKKKHVEKGEGSGVNKDGEEGGPKKKQKMQPQEQAEALKIVESFHGIHLQPHQPPKWPGADQPHLQQQPLKRSARIGMRKLAQKVSGAGESGAHPMDIE